MTNSSPEGRQEAAVLDATALHKLQLWFFRDISDEERLSLFSIFGMPVDEIGKVHGHQRHALNHILRALIPAKPAMEVVEALIDARDCMSRAADILDQDGRVVEAGRLRRSADYCRAALQAPATPDAQTGYSAAPVKP